MTPQQLVELIGSDEARIIEAIQAGSQWEIWFQIEAYILVKQVGFSAAREVPYPPPNDRLRLDLLIGQGNQRFAVEMKVESATNAGSFGGKSLTKAVEDDVNKIREYNIDGLSGRYVLIVAYSDRSKGQLANLINQFGNNSYYAENTIGVGVFNV